MPDRYSLVDVYFETHKKKRTPINPLWKIIKDEFHKLLQSTWFRDMQSVVETYSIDRHEEDFGDGNLKKKQVDCLFKEFEQIVNHKTSLITKWKVLEIPGIALGEYEYKLLGFLKDHASGFLAIIGDIGIGKTTFLRYMFDFVLKSEQIREFMGDPRVLTLDLNQQIALLKAAYEDGNLEIELHGWILKSLKKDLHDRNDFLRFYVRAGHFGQQKFDDLTDFMQSGNEEELKKLLSAVNEEINRVIDGEEKSQSKRTKLLSCLLEYLMKSENRKTILVFDNLDIIYDYHKVGFHKSLLESIRRYSLHYRCITIMSLRYTTSVKMSKDKFFVQFVLYLTPPKLGSVFTKLMAKALKSSNFDLKSIPFQSDVNWVTPQNELFNIFMSLAKHFLSPYNERIIVELGNYNIRRSLELLAHIFAHRGFPVREFLLVVSGRQTTEYFRRYQKRVNLVISALSSGRFCLYNHDKSVIPNLFFVPGPNSPQNYLVKLMLLLYFKKFNYVLKDDLFFVFNNLLFDSELVNSALVDLEKKECLKTLAHDLAGKNEIIMVKHAGMCVLERLLPLVHYAYCVKPDISLPRSAYSDDVDFVLEKYLNSEEDQAFLTAESIMLLKFLRDKYIEYLRDLKRNCQSIGSVLKANLFLFKKDHFFKILESWQRYHSRRNRPKGAKTMTEIYPKALQYLEKWPGESKRRYQDLRDGTMQFERDMTGQSASILEVERRLLMTNELEARINDLHVLAVQAAPEFEARLKAMLPQVSYSKRVEKEVVPQVKDYLKSVADMFTGSGEILKHVNGITAIVSDLLKWSG